MASTVDLTGVSVDPILHALDLHLDAGESVALLGRSGAGKTTILRLLNGLTTPTRGTVTIDDVPLAPATITQQRRRIGTILQAPALFPHQTVFDNIATVPRLHGWDEARIAAAARTLLERLDLPFDRFAHRKPRSLSGGEQQRVGIARATIADPPLLLCDEPFSALDPLLRRELQDAFIRVRDAGTATMLFVTHDVAEAVRVAKRIVLIDAGAIHCDAPRDAFLASDLPLVRRFLEAARW